MEDRETKYNVPALGRADAVLRVIAEEPFKWKFTDLYKHLDISKSTLHALLNTLERLHWIRRDRNETFALGSAIGKLGSAYLGQFDVVEEFKREAEPVMQRLQETVQIARLEGDQVLYLARVQSNSPVQMVAGPGVRFPVHATGVGKCLLSALTQEELDQVFPNPTLPKITVHTIGTKEALQAELTKVVQNGYATDEQEGVMGFCCVAAPVRQHGKVVAAVSCSMPIYNWNGKREAAVREILNLAELLSTG